jgi:multidrug efflux pump subunit AcrB
MRARGVTIAVLVGMLALSIYGFRFLQNSFFPDSTRAQFMVDVWLPGGTLDQTETRSNAKVIADIPHYASHNVRGQGPAVPSYLFTRAI